MVTEMLTFRLVTLAHEFATEQGRDLNALPPAEVDRFAAMATESNLWDLAQQMAAACPPAAPRDPWGDW
jgi:hypothetical protein